MTQVILAVLITIAYLLTYYIFGAAVSKLLKLENKPIIQILYGMFVYGILFFVYVIPLKWKLVPLTTIGRIWFILMAVVCLVLIIVCRKYMLEGLKSWMADIKEHKLSAVLVSIYTVIFMVYIEFFERIYYGYIQPTFIGMVSTSVFRNELMTYHSVTGLPLEVFPKERVLSTVYDHSAMVCKMTGLHPMVETRSVLVGLFILTHVMVIWEMAKYFGKGNEKKSLIAFFVYFALRNIMSLSTILPGGFTMFRTFETKGFITNVPIAMLLLILWRMYDNPDERGVIWKSLFIIWGGMTYSFALMISAPFLFAAYVPFVLARKSGRLIRNIIVMLFFSFIFMLVYFLILSGRIDLTIHR